MKRKSTMERICNPSQKIRLKICARGSGKVYGVNGEPTNLTDINGTRLYLGDKVRIRSSSDYTYISVVVRKEDPLLAFVEGIFDYYNEQQQGIDGWTCELISSFTERKVGEVIRGIKFIPF